jgi:phage terminase large subunit-like protein
MGRILPEGYAGESGYMLCRDGNVWLVICLAAQCERKDDPLGRQIGEMIWSEWFGEGYWAEKRMNPRSWASLYQQRPAPEEGAFFKREWFKRYEVLPLGDNWIGFDGAVTDEEENSEADDTVLQVWRVDEFARLYLVDEYCKATTMDIWIEVMLKKGIAFKPMKIVGESGIIRRAAEPFLKRAMLKMKAWFAFEWVTRHSNKPAMARGAQAMAASGQIFIPYGQVGDDFIDECLRFPTSKKDNRVDAFVNLCLHLEHIWEASPPKTVKEERPIIEGGGIPIKKLGYKNPEKLGVRKNRWNRKTSPQIQ